jgi:putative ATPase
MSEKNIPLAERMRPKYLSDYIGQNHLLGEGKPLRLMVNHGVLPSLIFCGAPGVGKTTLAQVLAREFDMPFYSLSAVHAGVKDVKDLLESLQKQGMFKQKALLFIDEIHRFNKAQQDSLLQAVEKGWITLLGATTENPSFEINKALLSRTQVYHLTPFSSADLLLMLENALQKDTVLKPRNLQIEDPSHLITLSGGDARRLFNLLEMAVMVLPEDVHVIAKSALQDVLPQLHYDKDGEMHYDIISAFIKSIRGSDVQATVYWLARMISAGESPRFIARRMMISAAEDIGLANANALLMASQAFQTSEVVGFPEARIILAECAIYLAKSPKSNAAYLAINQAMREVEQSGNLPVPLHLRNAPTDMMKNMGYGKGYIYPHDFAGKEINQTYLPENLLNAVFYEEKTNKTS